MIRYFWGCPNCKKINRFKPMCSPSLNPHAVERVACSIGCGTVFEASTIEEAGLVMTKEECLNKLVEDRKVEEVAHKLGSRCGCKVSSGICGCITFGTGHLDSTGFWSCPCPHGSEVHTCF